MAVRVVFPAQRLQPAGGDALPHLVGDLFGDQAQDALCSGDLCGNSSCASQAPCEQRQFRQCGGAGAVQVKASPHYPVSKQAGLGGYGNTSPAAISATLTGYPQSFADDVIMSDA